MAISTLWSNFANGATGLSIRNALNTFNTNILANMISTEGRVTTAEGTLATTTSTANANAAALAALNGTDVAITDTSLGITATTAQEAIDVLGKVGLVVMSGTNLTPQVIGVTAEKVNLYDSLTVQAGVGVTGSVSTSRATVTLPGIYKIRFEAFLSYPSNVDITWRLYKNGAATTNSITLTGQGSKIFQIILLTSTTLLATDYIELYAEASTSTTITMASTNGTIEKTIF